MNFDIIEGPESSFAYFEPNEGIAFVSSHPKVQETRTVSDADLNLGQREFAPWGTDNLKPFEIIKRIDVSSQLDSIIKRKVELLTSGGIQYGLIKTNDQGERILVPKIHTEIEEFLERTEAYRNLEEAAYDLYTYQNTFCEMTLDVGRRVTGIYNNDASECRLGLQNRSGSRKGMIDKVFLSADWRTRYAGGDVMTVDAVDPYYDVAAQIKNGRAHKYIIPDRLQMRGRKYYQRSMIENLIDSLWLDIAEAIPKWKEQVMNNQVSITRTVQVSDEYWNRKYPKFGTLPKSKQKEIERNEINAFLTFFKKKQGGVHLSKFRQQGKDIYPDWIIKEVGSEKAFAEGAYLEDATQCDFQIARGMGIHPSLVGTSPGKGFGAGSGSDIRMAQNSYVLGAKPDQRRLLRKYHYAAAINGWNKQYGESDAVFGFWFENFFIATLDHGRDTKKAKGES